MSQPLSRYAWLVLIACHAMLIVGLWAWAGPLTGALLVLPLLLNSCGGGYGRISLSDAPKIVKLDEIGRAETFEQTGWKVEYLEYQAVNSLALPRKLTLSNGSRSFRLVIDEWSGTP